MADISQIKLPNNTVLDLKDTVARNAIVEAEAMADVKSMLAKYGLNTTTEFTLATADTAAADGTVLAE